MVNMDADGEMMLEPGDYEMIDMLGNSSSSPHFTDENLFDFDEHSVCSDSTLLLFDEMDFEEELKEFQPPDLSQYGDQRIDLRSPGDTARQSTRRFRRSARLAGDHVYLPKD